MRIYEWFFMHCRNHHCNNHVNHVIILLTKWTGHNMDEMLSLFTVGPWCVEFYYDPSPPSSMTFDFTQEGTMTRFARDFLLETCVEPFIYNNSQVFIKVYNDNPGLKQPRVVQIQVIGYNIRCDPIGGINMILMPSCDDPENCRNHVICGNTVMTYIGEMPRCVSHCELNYSDWDYAVLNIIKVDDLAFSYTSWQICEIGVIGWIFSLFSPFGVKDLGHNLGTIMWRLWQQGIYFSASLTKTPWYSFMNLHWKIATLLLFLPLLKIRRSLMRIPKPGKTVFILKRAPGCLYPRRCTFIAHGHWILASHNVTSLLFMPRTWSSGCYILPWYL